MHVYMLNYNVTEITMLNNSVNMINGFRKTKFFVSFLVFEKQSFLYISGYHKVTMTVGEVLKKYS